MIMPTSRTLSRSVSSVPASPALCHCFICTSVVSMTEQEPSALRQLRSTWLGVYHVALNDDVWRAKRYHQVTHVLTADSADELGDAIKRDYDAMVTP